MTGNHGGTTQPELEEEPVETTGAADSSQMPDELPLTVAASRPYAELAEDVAVTEYTQYTENSVDARARRLGFGPLGWAAVALCLLAGVLWWGGPEPSSSPPSARLVSATGTAAPALSEPSTKDIDAIRVGELVLAQDPETGETCAKRVTQVFRHTADHVRVLKIAVAEGSGTQTIQTTDNHPFWVPGKDWVDAGELCVGDPVLQSDGRTATITRTRREEHPQGIAVYNVEVEGFHTYFVAAIGGHARPVLVHNKNGAPSSTPSLSPILQRQKDLTHLVNRQGAVVDRWLGTNNSRWAQAYRANLQTNPNFAKGIRGRILDVRMRARFRDMYGDVPGIRIDQTIPGSGNSLRPDLYFPNIDSRRVLFDVGSPSKVSDILKYERMADEVIPLIPEQWFPR
ncbi:MAG: hypothetical protein HQ582_09130 [Planctomycetes bacterium]|nr:hypothetical protein [Planctomycetota bacterium]